MKKLLSICKWAGYVALAVLGLGSFVLFVCLPSVDQWEQWQALSDALTGARAVTFIEFTPHYFDGDQGKEILRDLVFQQIPATNKTIRQLRSATGRFLTFNIYYSFAGCFVPHHRVEVVRSNGKVFRFDVCFHCQNFQFTGGDDQPIPASWLPPLRRFFIDLGMPPRTDEEYQQKAEKQVKTQPNTQ